jgi:hypothetical protein
VQSKTDGSKSYISNNYVDAQSIAISDNKSTIIVSLNDYEDLDKIAWSIEAGKSQPERIIVTANNFSPETQEKIYQHTESLRASGKKVLVAMGKGKNTDYEQLSINEALRAVDTNLTGDKYMKTRSLDGGGLERSGVTSEKGKPVSKTDTYYAPLSDEQKNKLQNYFVAVSQLSKADTYENAVKVAQRAESVYQAFKSEVKSLRKHPQSLVNKESMKPINTIKEQIMSQSKVGLMDLAAIMKEVAKPKLDSQTEKLIVDISNKIGKFDNGPAYKELVSKLHSEKSELIKAIGREDMLGESLSRFTTKEAKSVEPGKVDRSVFLGVVKATDRSIEHDKSKAKEISKKTDQSRDDRSR